MKVNKNDIFKGVVALFAALVTICALVLPSFAAEVSNNQTWFNNLSFPLCVGESLSDVENIHVYMSMEGYTDGTSSSGVFVSTGVFDSMKHGAIGGYKNLVPDSVCVFVYENGWKEITNNTLRLFSDLKGENFSGAFYVNDEAQKNITYGEYFGTYSSAKEYSLTTLTGTFAVRWSAQNMLGNVANMVYFGVPFNNTNAGRNNNDFVQYLGALSHPRDMFNSAYGVGAADQKSYDQAAYDSMIAEMNEKISAAYTKGYTDAAETGVKINTDDPWNAVISFFSALFIGVRNVVSPIFAVEIAGIPVATILGVLVMLVVVALAITIIVKVKG